MENLQTISKTATPLRNIGKLVQAAGNDGVGNSMRTAARGLDVVRKASKVNENGVAKTVLNTSATFVKGFKNFESFGKYVPYVGGCLEIAGLAIDLQYGTPTSKAAAVLKIASILVKNGVPGGQAIGEALKYIGDFMYIDLNDWLSKIKEFKEESDAYRQSIYDMDPDFWDNELASVYCLDGT